MIATETPAKPARKPLPDEALHVLVVDDDRRLRDLLAWFLGDNGYRVQRRRAQRKPIVARSSRLRRDRARCDDARRKRLDFARRFRKRFRRSDPDADRLADGKDRINGLEIGVSNT